MIQSNRDITQEFVEISKKCLRARKDGSINVVRTSKEEDCPLAFDFDSIPAPLAIFDGEGKPKAVNRSYRERFGAVVLPAHRRQVSLGMPSDNCTTLASGDILVSFTAEREDLTRRVELCSQAMSLSQVGAWRYLLEDRSLEFSEELYQVFGLSREWNVSSDSMASIFAEQDLENLREACRQTIESGVPFDLELPFDSPHSGKRQWVRIFGRAEHLDEVCLALSGAVQDITEKRQTGEKLAEILEQFAFAQKSAGFGVWDYHPDTKYLHWDDTNFVLYDVDPAGFTGQFEDWANCVVPEDLDDAVTALNAAIGGEKDFDTEFRIRLRDGRIRWIKGTAHATRDEAGKAQRMVGFNYDITPIKEVEEELRASNLRLAESNKRLEELAASSMAASLAKSEFLANMSHEIRTPMNGVLGMTTVLMETELTPHQRDSVDIVRKSAEALLLLINDLLDFSKVEAGSVRLDAQEVDLRDSVDDLVEFLALEAQRKGLDFFYRVSARVPQTVKLDPGRLRQVLINLVGNAVKFTQKGAVTVLLDADEQHLLFTVRDTGPGIEPAEQTRIFEPFTQGKSLASAGGTGLGLAICKRLAHLMGGILSLESRPGLGTSFLLKIPRIDAEPSGTEHLTVRRRVALTGGRPKERRSLLQALKFLGAEVAEESVDVEFLFRGAEPVQEGAEQYLVVPACDAAKYADVTEQGFRGIVTRPFRRRPLEQLLSTSGEASDERRKAVPASDPLDCRILLVEDNLVNQEVAAKMLSKIGAHHDTVENGREALKMLARQRYDLILMDLQMPGMSGFETTKQLKSDSRYSLNLETPVVALTAHATREHKERCFEVGMSDYLTKPLRLNEIRAVVEKWVAS